MMWFRELWRRLTALSRRKQIDADLEEEMRLHMDLRAQQQAEAGLNLDDARYTARRKFGNLLLLQEAAREVWGWASLERLWQDLRYAIRMLRNSPGFTAVALLSLTLGIGANTAIFSLLNAVILRLLPVPDPQQLVQFTYTIPSSGPDNWNSWFGYPHLERFREQSRTLSGVFGGVSLNGVNVGWHGTAGLAQCDAYTGNFFSVLEVAPQQGRLFVADDDRPGADAVVLSDGYWRTRFGGDPRIVGQTILIDQLPFVVIGITPPRFSIYTTAERDLWVPLHAIDRFTPDPSRWHAAFSSWLLIAGRLQPGVPVAAAEAELDLIHRRLLAEQLAASDRYGRQSLERLVRESHLLLRPAANGMLTGIRQMYALPLKLLMGVAAMVLLISCANVANLVLARASHRRRDIAVRMALGSGRARVIRQLLTENLLLAGVGGVLALAVARWGSIALVCMISTGDSLVPLDVHPDWHLFGFTAAVSVASGVLFGLVPAVRTTRVDPTSALKEGSRSSTRFSRLPDRMLVGIQMTLSLVLITGAGLFTQTLGNLRHVDVGYDRDNILMFSVDAKLGGYSGKRAGALYRAILDHTSAVPGVQSASMSIARPVDDQYYLIDRIGQVDGHDLPEAETIKVAWNSMSPGYFSTVGTPILLGRDFDLRDSGRAEKVVIVNESLARQALPGRNPIGHHLDGAEIIGMVKDSLYGGARDQLRPVLYRLLFQSEGGTDQSQWVGAGAVSVELRYRSGSGLVDEVRQAVASVDRYLPIFRVKTLRAQTEDSFLRERLLATISSFFGGLALLLACLGLYGLMAYAVARRTAEIGIRMALGARSKEVVWLILRQTLLLVLCGIASGVPLAIWFARYTKSLLFGIAPADPLVIAAATLLLMGSAVLAAFLPARRASRIDPMVALRYE